MQGPIVFDPGAQLQIAIQSRKRRRFKGHYSSSSADQSRKKTSRPAPHDASPLPL